MELWRTRPTSAPYAEASLGLSRVWDDPELRPIYFLTDEQDGMCPPRGGRLPVWRSFHEANPRVHLRPARRRLYGRPKQERATGRVAHHCPKARHPRALPVESAQAVGLGS